MLGRLGLSSGLEASSFSVIFSHQPARHIIFSFFLFFVKRLVTSNLYQCVPL